LAPLRILQLCNKPPLPAKDGGCLAMLRMTEGFLAAGNEVTVLSIATDKHPWQPEKIDAAFKAATKMDALHIDTSVRWLPAFLALFKTSSYNIDRFYSLGFEAKLIEILSRSEFDVVQLESLYLCPYISAIRRLSKARIVLRAHNTESAIWMKNASEESDPFKKLWFRDLAGKLERYEQKAISEVDAIVTITADDEVRLRNLGAKVPMHVATYAMRLNPEAGLRKPEQQETENRKSATVFHIGSMDWKPNYDGVKWFLKDVWPSVLQKVPGITLHLAGKAMNKEEFSGLQNVVSHGEVDNAADFLAAYNIMIVPLNGGGGVKVKMIEGMFAGKAIVTTPVGAEGIAGIPEKDFKLATDAKTFADYIVDLIDNPELAKEIGMNAQKTANENHELSRVTGKLCDFYRTILS
jgi:glycosyltransferase involved in cell wall biosynthesis